MTTKGIEVATGKLFDYFKDYITLTDNDEFNKVLKKPETQDMIKALVTKEVINAFKNGSPVDDRGRPLHKTESERVAASLMSIAKEMWGRGTNFDQLTDDIAFFDRNVESLTKEIAQYAEGVTFEYQQKIDQANKMIDKASNWLSQ